MMCFCGILVMVFIVGIAGLRIIFGPLPSTLCWWHIFFNQSIGVAIMLVLDVYYLSRVNEHIFFITFEFYFAPNSTFMLLLSKALPFAMMISLEPSSF